MNVSGGFVKYEIRTNPPALLRAENQTSPNPKFWDSHWRKSNKPATKRTWNHFLRWSLGALASNYRYLPYDFRAKRAEEIYFCNIELLPLQESLWTVTGRGNLSGPSSLGSLDMWISVGWHVCITAGYFPQEDSVRSTREPHVLVSEGRPPQLDIFLT